MRLAISNIAWRPQERTAVYGLMSEFGAKGLEIAPAQAFPDEADAFRPSAAAVDTLRGELDRAGLILVSMQSLLFGVSDAKLFGTPVERGRLEERLTRAVELAGRLGIANVVMGSPANRVVPDGLPAPEAERIAIEVFRRIGDVCLDVGTRLALEPNAASYGTNFLTTMEETIGFARRVAHPGIGVNFDIGNLHMNGDFADGGTLFAAAGTLASHVHVSEPALAPAPADAETFEHLARDILRTGYGGWFSIEMRATSDDNVGAVAAALARTASALAAAGSTRG